MENRSLKVLKDMVDKLNVQNSEAMNKLKESTKVLSDLVKERDELRRQNRLLMEERNDLLNEIQMLRTLNKPKEQSKPKGLMFLENTPDYDDEDVNELYNFMEKVFDGINAKTNGAFYEVYDGFVTRDKDGKVHLHLYER